MMNRIWQGCCFAMMACGLLWASASGVAQDVSPWQRPESSKALLESLGLKLDEIRDREKRSDENLELYLRVLTRLRQLPLGVIHEWAKDQPLFKAIDGEPEKYRGQMFKIEGLLVTQEKFDLPSDLAERFNLKSLYKLEISLNDSANSKNVPANGVPPGAIGIPLDTILEPMIEVWVTQIPEGLIDFRYLEKGGPGDPNRRVAVDAIFLMISKWAPKPDSVFTSPVFVADQLRWFPDVESKAFPVTSSMAALGKVGFDAGLLDAVREETSKRLTAEVTEPFLQMLAAQSRVDWAGLEARPLQLGKLISQPKEFVGEAIEFDAVARRVVEIAIENESDRKRLGLDRYYEIDVVIPKPIRTIVKDKDGKEREVEQSNFPMTICSTEPPQGIEIGADVRERIRAKAFFFKLWAYESKFAQEQSIDAMQVSPLFITARVERAPAAEVSSRSLWVVVGGVIGFMGLIAVWGYLLLRGDDLQEKRRKVAKQQVIEAATNPGPASDSVVHD